MQRKYENSECKIDMYNRICIIGNSGILINLVAAFYILLYFT
jgi:hypothetical protein